MRGWGKEWKTVVGMCRVTRYAYCLWDLCEVLWESQSTSYYYGSGCLHKIAIRIHFGLRLNSSRDTLAGCALLHMFPRSRPRTWTVSTANSSVYKRNVMYLAAVAKTHTISGICTVMLRARRPALVALSYHKDVPYTSPNPNTSQKAMEPTVQSTNPAALLSKPTPRHQPLA